MSSLATLRLSAPRAIGRIQARTFLSTPRVFKEGASLDTGRPPEEHVTNQKHHHNIQSDASNKGQKARAGDTAETHGHNTFKSSGATSEETTTTAKEAEAASGRKDRGMGLQDERGGKGH